MDRQQEPLNNQSLPAGFFDNDYVNSNDDLLHDYDCCTHHDDLDPCNHDYGACDHNDCACPEHNHDNIPYYYDNRGIYHYDLDGTRHYDDPDPAGNRD